MHSLAIALALIVAVEHLYIMLLEMFFSSSNVASRTFGLPKEFLAQKNVRVLFANQGLYNGFLAVGILLSLFALPSDVAKTGVLFFVGCFLLAVYWWLRYLVPSRRLGRFYSSKAYLHCLPYWHC